jgi:hypothetical protein
MKEFYKKYKNWFVVILFFLFGLKSCQSCSRQRSIEYNKIKYEHVIDSLQVLIESKNDTITSQQNNLKIYKVNLGLVEDSNKALRESNKRFQSTNRVLVYVNKNLSNKTE